MIGGYGVYDTSPLTNKRKYDAPNYLNCWLNISSRGIHWQLSAFGGYCKNMGSGKKITGPTYGRDMDIAYAYRIAPMISYLNSKLNCSLEGEYTVAAYGLADPNFHFSQNRELANLRLTLSITYLL